MNEELKGLLEAVNKLANEHPRPYGHTATHISHGFKGSKASVSPLLGDLKELGYLRTQKVKIPGSSMPAATYYQLSVKGKAILAINKPYLMPVAAANPVSTGTLDALHKDIKAKCSNLYLSENYPEAVEKGFKVVRDRLRELTTFETGSDAFGRGGLYIKGATAPHVDNDFQQAVKFLTMAIDQFRNEKSHTSDGKIENPVRAYEYLALSSLAMHLLDDVEIKPSEEKPKVTKTIGNNQPKQNPKQQQVTLDPLQVLAMRAFGAMKDYKGLLISYLSGGPALVSPLSEISDEEIATALNAIDGQEMKANLDQLARWGIVSADSNSNGSPLYTLAKGGYDFLKEHPEINKT